ncbi:XRE family transcriptional regulator [Dolichospermum sp. UHCC 0684]|jgi:2'-deoxynucleoside 5'-phosphate N-hydrolase|uniref:XRE family transcriptional regulator n=1 Tax=Dolichospermum flos-aquae CCAP 1403/13F TaxID=315271 RepID=A0A6H2BVX1_DOLFA|nr:MULTISPECIES: XRE family transcriptional regulator [Dolichospermum]MEA5531348.1 XRE family transcriptional regulator [Dolichospermum sp. UHCC 0684]MTJ35113.1 XRE family transcriptional regulator [Dolichospermum sp. UHCC 0260]QJB43323.1 XRE family transcriptional regulator [Dolichospermum flos-aquae CCAP 1403/13F]
MKMYKIYVSGALTDVENPIETKALYEKIGLVCEKVGLQAYVPHLHTDPVNNPDITPREVFDKDKYEVSISDLVIAYLGSLSFGVGMELAYAENNKIPIILLYETGKRISRFPRGIPTVIAEIQFNDYEDALNQLKEVLLKWKQ